MNEIMQSVTAGMDLETAMLSEVKQRKINIVMICAI